MGSLVALLLVPLAWPFLAKAKWRHEITWLEMGLNLLAGVLTATVAYYASVHVQASDVEIHNGLLRSKASEHVSCSHSYSCNCRDECSGSGAQRSCSRRCDTCYEHPYDIDWNLITDVGTVTVARVDRRGTTEPPRFTRASIGEPVSLAKPFQNYIKAAPDSLFNAVSEVQLKAAFDGRLPAYPHSVRDYHYVDRVLTQGLTLPERDAWNAELAALLARIGPKKQVNVVVVLTAEVNPQYAEALRAAWLGGKKNDVVVVMGTPSYPALAWVRVFSWTDKELFKVELRDALAAQPTVDRGKMLATIAQQIDKQFVRKPMADFEYLKNEIALPAWLVVLLGFLSAGVSVGLSIFFSRNRHRASAR